MNYQEALTLTDIPLERYEAALLHAAVNLRQKMGLTGRGPEYQSLRAVTQAVFDAQMAYEGPVNPLVALCVQVSRLLHLSEGAHVLVNADEQLMYTRMEEVLKVLA